MGVKNRGEGGVGKKVLGNGFGGRKEVDVDFKAGQFVGMDGRKAGVFGGSGNGVADNFFGKIFPGRQKGADAAAKIIISLVKRDKNAFFLTEKRGGKVGWQRQEGAVFEIVSNTFPGEGGIVKMSHFEFILADFVVK